MGLPDPGAEGNSARNNFLTPILNEKPLWCGLYENVHDRMFPPRLPPLELTSQPVPVPDRMAANTNPWAVGTATLVNGAILAAILLLGLRVVNPTPPYSNPVTGKFDIKNLPLFTPMRLRNPDAGNGGGTNDLIDPNKGKNPKQDMHPLAPVQIPVLEHPQLPVENAIAVPPEVKLPDNQAITMIGVHTSSNVTLVSGGPGGPTGIGTGPGGGVGPGNGSVGWGPGSHPGIYTPGVGGVTQPVPIFTPEAEFSDEARRQKYQGVCEISLIVDAQGNPQSPRLVQRLGMGLDEKALDAVMRYKFKPAKKDGKPVPVRMSVMVNFRLY